MTEARPVQQVNNPIKEPLWKKTSMDFMNDTWRALDNYCENSGFDKKNTIDVALREYLGLPEPEAE